MVWYAKSTRKFISQSDTSLMRIILAFCFFHFFLFSNDSLANSLDDWKRLTNDATSLSKQKKFSEAFAVSNQALAIAERDFRNTPNRILTSLNQVGAVLQANEQYSDAEIFFSRAIELQINTDPNNQRAMVRVLNSLAKLLLLKGEADDAERIFENIVQRIEIGNGRNSGGLMEPLTYLAKLYLYKGKVVEANKALMRALDINKKLGIQLGRDLSLAIDELNARYRQENKSMDSEELEKIRLGISPSLPANHWAEVKPEIDFSKCRLNYPSTAVKYDLQGVDVIKVLIDIDGSAIKTEAVKSSGWQTLDDALAMKIQTCNARPAMQEGNPVSAWTTVEYHWRIDENNKLIEPSFEVIRDSCMRSDQFTLSPDKTVNATIRFAFKLNKDNQLKTAEIVDLSSTGDLEIDQAALSYLNTCKFRRLNSGNSFGHIWLRWSKPLVKGAPVSAIGAIRTASPYV